MNTLDGRKRRRHELIGNVLGGKGCTREDDEGRGSATPTCSAA